MSYMYSPAGFPGTLTQIVSAAAAELPLFSRPQDQEFLSQALALAADAFWENYVTLESAEAQQEYLDAAEAEDDQAFLAWFRKYANFAEDAAAEEKGAKILEDIAAKLPKILADLYPKFG